MIKQIDPDANMKINFRNSLRTRLRPDVFKALHIFPFFMLVAILASVPFLTYQAIFTPGEENLSITNWIYVLLLIPVALYLKKLWNSWTKQPPALSQINYLLLAFGLLIIANRSLIYFHSIDDFVHHMVQGHFARTLWNSKDFLPLGFLSYLYPFLQISYSYFLDAIGIRLTILFFEFGKLLWLLSLNLRFGTLLKKKAGLPFWASNLIFFLFYSMPEVTVTHATFMSDLFSLLFGLEFLYLYLTRMPIKLMVSMFLGMLLSKQSSGIIAAPLGVFLLFNTAIKDFRGFLKEAILPIGLVTISFIRSWVDTASPLPGLYNSVFQSPLFPLDTFKDRRWGPSSFQQSLFWPLYAYFSPKYLELPVSALFSRVLYALPPIGVFLGSAILFLKSKKRLFLIIFLSFYFWTFISGYGRYFVTMFGMSLLLMLFSHKVTWFRLGSITIGKKRMLVAIALLYLLVLGASLSAFRIDYASRPQLFSSWMRPWQINPYFLNLTDHGVALIGHDRPVDIYNELQNELGQTKVASIVVADRGLSTYYANILGRFMDIPVYTALTPNDVPRIANYSGINVGFKEKARLSVSEFPILLVVDNDPFILSHRLSQTQLFLSGRCKTIGVGGPSKIFPHENYFSYVQKYLCE